MAVIETVYAIHNFEAENDDEIAFNVGEPVIVLEKDDGYNDGWWQGRNVRGEVGLFPVNYTSFRPHGPPVVSLDAEHDSLEQSASMMETDCSSEESTSLPPQRTPSFVVNRPSRQSLAKTDSVASTLSALSHSVPAQTNTTISPTPKNILKTLRSTLKLEALRDTAPEEWDVDQVSLWLRAMGFESVADHFKFQEITGDILLALTLDSLKELEVNTFGKRFKLYNAIIALRDETARQDGRQPHESFDKNAHYRHPAEVVGRSRHIEISTRISRVQWAPNENGSAHQTNRGYDIQDRGSNDTGCDTASLYSREYSMDSTVSGRIERQPIRQISKRKTVAVSSHASSPSAMVHSRISNESGPSSSPPSVKSNAILSVASRGSLDSYPHRSGLSHVEPDMEGWLHKQGDKYKTWNKRWFVLKGPNLFYFKSPKDVRMKGIINLRGYKIICDELIHVGNYCFKAQHEKERTFYFYTEVECVMKAWVKALMKATITRDFSTPVMSSSTIPTVTLEIARRMKPRPPSMILYKKENRHSTDTPPPRSVSKESIHNPLSPPSPRPRPLGGSSHRSSIIVRGVHTPEIRVDSKHDLQDSGFDSHSRVTLTVTTPPAIIYYEPEPDEENEADNDGEEDDDEQDMPHQRPSQHRMNDIRRTTPSAIGHRASPFWQAKDYLEWVNQWVDHKISDLASLRTGTVLLELLENISGKEMRRPRPTANSSSRIHMIDNVTTVFKFMRREGIEMKDRVSIEDVCGGDEHKIQAILGAIKTWSDELDRKEKDASGTTYDEQEQDP